MAFYASLFEANSTKPKPLGFPVILSVGNLILTTLPNFPKALLREFSSELKLKFPTNNSFGWSPCISSSSPFSSSSASSSSSSSSSESCFLAAGFFLSDTFDAFLAAGFFLSSSELSSSLSSSESSFFAGAFLAGTAAFLLTMTGTSDSSLSLSSLSESFFLAAAFAGAALVCAAFPFPALTFEFFLAYGLAFVSSSESESSELSSLSSFFAAALTGAFFATSALVG